MKSIKDRQKERKNDQTNERTNVAAAAAATVIIKQSIMHTDTTQSTECLKAI